MRRWTPKLAIARSERNIQAAKDRLAAVAFEWGDVDESFVQAAEDLIADLTAFFERIKSDVADRQAAGEHVGL